MIQFLKIKTIIPLGSRVITLIISAPDTGWWESEELSCDGGDIGGVSRHFF